MSKGTGVVINVYPSGFEISILPAYFGATINTIKVVSSCVALNLQGCPGRSDLRKVVNGVPRLG
jgi:hypothetical protein